VHDRVSNQLVSISTQSLGGDRVQIEETSVCIDDNRFRSRFDDRPIVGVVGQAGHRANIRG
jgi:hypothetical protein